MRPPGLPTFYAFQAAFAQFLAGFVFWFALFADAMFDTRRDAPFRRDFHFPCLSKFRSQSFVLEGLYNGGPCVSYFFQNLEATDCRWVYFYVQRRRAFSLFVLSRAASGSWFISL
jgi:hypothetical protein